MTISVADLHTTVRTVHRQIIDTYHIHRYAECRPRIKMHWEGLYYVHDPCPAIVWEGGPWEWAVLWSLGDHGYGPGWMTEAETGFILTFHRL